MSKVRLGEAAWTKVPKVNAELFTLTYGALVVQLIKDYEDVIEVNKQLEKMGYNIGLRLVEEFLAKSGCSMCANFKDTAESVAKVAFKMFLGVTTEISNWNSTGTTFSLLINDNPLTDFVELSPQHADLQYCNILCGVITGALEMVQMGVQCTIVKDILKGDDATEIRVELKENIQISLDQYKDS